jgi:chorismate mutase
VEPEASRLFFCPDPRQDRADDEDEMQGPVATRGIRGAITVDGESADAVGAVEALESAVAELLDSLVAANEVRLEDVASAVFTVTDDLAGANPAAAARASGWDLVPLLTVREHPGTEVSSCIRVLLLWNTTRSQAEVRHVYLRGAAVLRPDLVAPGHSNIHRTQP